jgi:uncharacterized protein YndB with AHSA1/START domain
MPMTAVESTLFTLSYAVERQLPARPERVWALLTDAAAFPTWNSTVTELVGPIAPGQRLQIRVPAAPGRTFSPRVTTFEAPSLMVWSDGFYPMFRGIRTFQLSPSGEGSLFRMEERFEGLMLPMIRSSLPDFAPIFERYAADLEAACRA